MGAWGAKPFQNDQALDWLLTLVDAEDDGPIVRAIEVAGGAEADAAIAAAAVVAAAAAEPVRGVPSEAKQWILQRGYVPSPDTVQRTIEMLETVVAEPELRDLWKEAELLKSWERAVGKIVNQLRSAIETGRPVRARKKPTMPRSLYKLVKLAARNPTDRVRAKVREKLNRLDHLDLSSNETGNQPPLCMLADAELAEEMKMLLDRGADPSVETFFSGSPLSIACRKGNVEIATLLIDAGAQLFSEAAIDAETGRRVYEQESGPKIKVIRYCQALWHAVTHGTPAVIDLLLGAGAELSQVDLSGDTLLHKACETDNARNLRHLIGLGMDVNQTKPDSQSPLHDAAIGNRIDCARVLLEHGANANIVDHYGWTPLDYAEEHEGPIRDILRKCGGKHAAELHGNGTTINGGKR